MLSPRGGSRNSIEYLTKTKHDLNRKEYSNNKNSVKNLTMLIVYHILLYQNFDRFVVDYFEKLDKWCCEQCCGLYEIWKIPKKTRRFLRRRRQNFMWISESVIAIIITWHNWSKTALNARFVALELWAQSTDIWYNNAIAWRTWLHPIILDVMSQNKWILWAIWGIVPIGLKDNLISNHKATAHRRTHRIDLYVSFFFHYVRYRSIIVWNIM